MKFDYINTQCATWKVRIIFSTKHVVDMKLISRKYRRRRKEDDLHLAINRALVIRRIRKTKSFMAKRNC